MREATHMILPLCERLVDPDAVSDELLRLRAELDVLLEQRAHGVTRHVDVAARIAGRLGELHHARGEAREAVTSFELSARLFHELRRSTPYLLACARAARAAGQLGAAAAREAADALTALLDGDDDTIARIWRDRLLAWRAECHAVAGDRDAARHDLEQALAVRRLNPRDDTTLLEQGLALLAPLRD